MSHQCIVNLFCYSRRRQMHFKYLKIFFLCIWLYATNNICCCVSISRVLICICLRTFWLVQQFFWLFDKQFLSCCFPHCSQWFQYTKSFSAFYAMFTKFAVIDNLLFTFVLFEDFELNFAHEHFPCNTIKFKGNYLVLYSIAQLY